MELDKNDFEKIFKLIMDENKRNLKSVQDELAEVKLQLNEAAVIRGENIALRATIEDYKRNLEETKCELKSQGDRLRIVEADNIGS
jgi:DNA-binding ferritin-like protein